MDQRYDSKAVALVEIRRSFFAPRAARYSAPSAAASTSVRPSGSNFVATRPAVRLSDSRTLSRISSSRFIVRPVAATIPSVSQTPFGFVRDGNVSR